MPVQTGDSLYTTVKNPTATERFYSFIGSKGSRLGAHETKTVRGDISSVLGAKRTRRKFEGLERALVTGKLEIISTPALHLYDATNDETRILKLQNGELGFVDPSWQSSSSFDPSIITPD